MKTNLLSKTGNKTRKRWQSIALALGFTAFANFANAQVDMTWLGTSSNNFMIEDNWDPAGSPASNNLIIPAQFDSLGNKIYEYAPVLTGSENLAVQEITVNFDVNNPDYQGSYTVDLESTDVSLTLNNGSNIQYGSSGIIINNGSVYFNSYKRFDQIGTYMIVNGGYVEFKRFLIMNKNGDTNTGGHITINGGTIRLNGSFHDRVSKNRNQITITGDGILEVAGNYGSSETDIESGWINGGENYYPIRAYDITSDLTTYSAVSMETVMFQDAERKQSTAGIGGEGVKLVLTNRIVNAKNIVWKYRKEGETSYTTFEESTSTPSFSPVFDTNGTFYVMSEITDENDVVVTSNEVEFFVIPDYFIITPEFNAVQYLRHGETGTTMTCGFKNVTPTKTEWKYSQVSGGPYISFESAQTDVTLNPEFSGFTGDCFVIMEAEIDGVTYQSAEILYQVQDASAVGLSITWTGMLSDDAKEPGNWNPVAHPKKNSIVVNGLPTKYVTNEAGDTIETILPNYPVFRNSGNDTLNHIGCYTPATLTFDGPDTIYTSAAGAQPYITGIMNVNKGTILSKSWNDPTITNVYWNIHAATGYVNISGDASMRLNTLLIGNKNVNDGGHVNLTDNGTLYIANLDRVVEEPSESVISISDNASFNQYGDVIAAIETRIDSGKIVCPNDGFEPYAIFDSEWTIVTARSTNAFAIENAELDIITPNTPISTEISLINVDGVTSWEWKWSETVNGPWNSFEPAAIDEPTYAPAFAESGVYYVVAVTSNNVQTTNMKEINVVNLSVSPADDQKIDNGNPTNLVTITIPEEVEFLSGMWLTEDTESNLSETGVTDTEFQTYLADPGTYYIYFYAEVQDANGNSYILNSNKVKVEYGSTGVNDIDMNLELYPNPTTGKFFINTNFNSKYTVEIINIAGVPVYKKEFTQNGQQTINFNEKGAYIVKVQAENEIQMNRLIVK